MCGRIQMGVFGGAMLLLAFSGLGLSAFFHEVHRAAPVATAPQDAGELCPVFVEYEDGGSRTEEVSCSTTASITPYVFVPACRSVKLVKFAHLHDGGIDESGCEILYCDGGTVVDHSPSCGVLHLIANGWPGDGW